MSDAATLGYVGYTRPEGGTFERVCRAIMCHHGPLALDVMGPQLWLAQGDSHFHPMPFEVGVRAIAIAWSILVIGS